MKIKLLFLLITQFIFSQHIFLSYPKVKMEDLTKKSSSIDSNSDAEVLYRSVHNQIDHNNLLKTTVVEKIKIYDKDKAGKYLDKEIQLYKISNGTEETISSFRAVTHNLVNDKIIESKVESNSKYSSKEDKNYVITKFAYPNVNNGSVLELNYTITSPFLQEIEKVSIEDDIPIVYSEYVFDSPLFITYNINYLGSLLPKHRKIAEESLYGSQYKTYRFGYENIPSFRVEKHVMNSNNYKTTIRAELSAILKKHENGYGSFSDNFTTNWDDVRKKLFLRDDFGDQLKKTSIAKKLLTEEIKSIKDERERADAVFRFVQKNFNWNNKNGVITDKGIKETAESKTGNVADINLLMILMMREANLKAHPIVLSTVGKGRLLTSLPSITKLNYVIAGVETSSGEVIIYDATSKFTKRNLIHPRAYNQKGIILIENDKIREAKEINIENPFVSNSNYNLSAILSEKFMFSGNLQNISTHMYSLIQQEESTNKLEFEKKIKSKYPFSLENLTYNTLENNDFKTTFDFETDGIADTIDQKIVFNPMLFLQMQKHSFDQKEDRKYPVELISAYENTIRTTVEIPIGYHFVDIPKSKKIQTQDNIINYNYSVSVENNKIIIETKLLVDSIFFDKEYYPALKQVFDAIVKYESQMVSISKK